jgi:hypothetical protein
MKVYIKWAKNKTMTLMVQPGRDHPENSDWMQPGLNGPVPITLSVVFKKGVAEVDKELGRWLIDTKQAHARPQPEVSGVHGFECPPQLIEVI